MHWTFMEPCQAFSVPVFYFSLVLHVFDWNAKTFFSWSRRGGGTTAWVASFTSQLYLPWLFWLDQRGNICLPPSCVYTVQCITVKCKAWYKDVPSFPLWWSWDSSSRCRRTDPSRRRELKAQAAKVIHKFIAFDCAIRTQGPQSLDLSYSKHLFLKD